MLVLLLSLWVSVEDLQRFPPLSHSCWASTVALREVQYWENRLHFEWDDRKADTIKAIIRETTKRWLLWSSLQNAHQREIDSKTTPYQRALCIQTVQIELFRLRVGLGEDAYQLGRLPGPIVMELYTRIE